MVFTAYICDDFSLDENGVLVIWGNYAEFTSNDSEIINKFINKSFEDAIVCPQLYVNKDGMRVKRVIFK